MSKKGVSRAKRKGKKGKKETENPWPYNNYLLLLLEVDKLSKHDLTNLCCRGNHCIKHVIYNTAEDCNNAMYKMYEAMVGQSVDFMRRWLQCYTEHITHKRTINKLAGAYLKSKGLKIATWLASIKTRKKADILAIYLLSKVTKTHCFIHVQNNKYWCTLENELTKHNELMQRCNHHLAYMGQGSFIQLELRTMLVEYEIFGVPESINVEQVDTKSIVTGTLTAEEDETLTQLLETGLSVHVSENKSDKSVNVSASASAGGPKDILRLEWELVGNEGDIFSKWAEKRRVITTKVTIHNLSFTKVTCNE